MAGRAHHIIELHRKALARERGWVAKEPGGRLNAVILYPNTYRVGMANLGLAQVYRIINQRTDALCERAFLPDGELAKTYAKTGAPLMSLESSRPIRDFDLILATISFENDAPNLARMLDMAGVGMEAGAADRPLVIAGGVACMLNPEPYAFMVDGFLLGEAEVVLDGFLDSLMENGGREKPALLRELAKSTTGFYPPSLYRPEYGPDGLLSGFTPDAGLAEKIPAPKHTGDKACLARSVFKAQGPEFGDMTLLEVGRGCGHACRFCAAGHIFRPPRMAKAGDFLAEAEAAAMEGGRVGLVAAAVSDLPGVEDLARVVVDNGGRLSVSSLRADRLSLELAGALAKSRHQTVALAPEAGSARLRRIINKHLKEEDLFGAVEVLISQGVPNLRLYFMVGLPGEEEEDVLAMTDMVKRVRQQVVSHSRVKGHLGRITVSLNAFIPKPFTPFQWEPMAGLKLVKKRMERVQRELAKTANVKVTTDVPKYALLQAVISRGDRRLAPLIKALAGGMNPNRAYKASGVDPAFYANRARGRNELLPWSFVDHGVSMQYLWAEKERALKGLESPICDPGRCHRCGACPIESESPDD